MEAHALRAGVPETGFTPCHPPAGFYALCAKIPETDFTPPPAGPKAAFAYATDNSASGFINYNTQSSSNSDFGKILDLI
ncbi:MAG: hypothetical protein LBK66_02455 [Spirochaetaceae bacterium]|nr:hypothetical protein [Spirochaetaceae bacterium]